MFVFDLARSTGTVPGYAPETGRIRCQLNGHAGNNGVRIASVLYIDHTVFNGDLSYILADDRDNDHQFDECEPRLCVFHFRFLQTGLFFLFQDGSVQACGSSASRGVGQFGHLNYY